MAHEKHHPITVNKVARQIFSLVAPLGDFDELTDEQREEWEAKAISILDTAAEVPTEGIAFFDETPEDLLAPWGGVLDITKTATIEEAVNWESEAPHDLIASGSPKRALQLVPGTGVDGEC